MDRKYSPCVHVMFKFLRLCQPKEQFHKGWPKNSGTEPLYNNRRCLINIHNICPKQLIYELSYLNVNQLFLFNYVFFNTLMSIYNVYFVRP